jgi:alanine-alpha-ketoisovalerate/valine-pyruvate aminotransferase
MIRKKAKNAELVIDLTGPDGNAFVLLAHANNFARQLGFDFEQIKREMTSGDYENLLNVFDSYFGKYVILERSFDDED